MNNLNALRSRAGLSRATLAKAIGVAEITVWTWEKGTRQMGAAKAKQALAVLAAAGVHSTLDEMYAAPKRKAA